MISPSDNDDGWSKLIVAGKESPGVVTISGATRTIGWDVKDADGQDGASTTRKGEPVGKFDATFYLVDDPVLGSDFDEWDDFQQLLLSSVAGESPVALEVVHPELQRLGWTAAVLSSLGDMVNDGMGGATTKVSFLEHRPPQAKPANSPSGTKTGGSGGSGGSGTGPAETEADKKIREAEAELEQLKEEGENLW